MARAIHWQVSFKSLKERQCYINIYEENYTGDIVQLTGATSPFVCDEDDDEDIVSTVLRTTTGYINLVEETEGELDALYPSVITDRYVEVLYNNAVVFKGFIQTFQGEQSWEPVPREVSFAVESPLKTLQGVPVDTTEEPKIMTLGEILKKGYEKLGVTYISIVTPELKDSDGTPVNPWQLTMNDYILRPYDDEYFYTNVNLWSPKTYGYFIEQLCRLFRWNVYETGSQLIFTDYMNGTSYRISPFASLSRYNPLTATSFSLSDYYEDGADDFQMSLVPPYKKMVFNLSREQLKRTIPLTRTRNNGTSDGPITFLYPYSKEFDSANKNWQNIPQTVLPNNDKPGKWGCFGLHYNKEGLSFDAFIAYLNGPEEKELFRFRCYGVPEGKLTFETEVTYNDRFSRMNAYNGAYAGLSFNVSFRDPDGFIIQDASGSASGTVEVSSASNKLSFSFDRMPQLDYVEAVIRYTPPVSTVSNGKMIGFISPTFITSDVLNNKYIVPEDIVVSSENNATSELSLQQDFNYDCQNEYTIHGNKSIRLPSYEFALGAQRRFKGTFRSSGTPSNDIHMPFVSFANKDWRIISRSLNLYDDEETLTLQRNVGDIRPLNDLKVKFKNRETISDNYIITDVDAMASNGLTPIFYPDNTTSLQKVVWLIPEVDDYYVTLNYDSSGSTTTDLNITVKHMTPVGSDYEFEVTAISCADYSIRKTVKITLHNTGEKPTT